MDIYDYVEGIRTKQDFEKFLDMLVNDFRNNTTDWENDDLEPFLDAFLRFTESIDGYYKNMNLKVDTSTPTWKMFAEMLLAAKVYE